MDPYLYLTDLGADVRLVGQGDSEHVQIRWWKGVPSERRRQGEALAKTYDCLLRLQLASEPPKSVQKLLAQGYITVVGRRYVLRGRGPDSPSEAPS